MTITRVLQVLGMLGCISLAGCDSRPSPELTGTPPSTTTVPYTADAPLSATALGIFGYCASPRDGVKSDIRVSKSLVVKGVPVDFIRGCAEFAKIRVAAHKLSGLPAEWVREATQDLYMLLNKNSPRGRDLLALEAQNMQSTYMYLPRILGPPRLMWLLFPFGSTHERRRIPLRNLVDRFDPCAGVSTENACDVAEEIVWEQELGYGDGTHASLPLARERIVREILHELGFDSNEEPGAIKETLGIFRQECEIARRAAPVEELRRANRRKARKDYAERLSAAGDDEAKWRLTLVYLRNLELWGSTDEELTESVKRIIMEQVNCANLWLKDFPGILMQTTWNPADLMTLGGAFSTRRVLHRFETERWPGYYSQEASRTYPGTWLKLMTGRHFEDEAAFKIWFEKNEASIAWRQALGRFGTETPGDLPR